MRPARFTPILLGLAALVWFALSAGTANAQDDWRIDSFRAQYDIQRSGAVQVTEDIEVQFFAAKHGIFRDMPIRYKYDDSHDRLISVGDVSVEDGDGNEWPFQLISSDANLQIKIGDPDRTITGEHRYVIKYTLLNALNPITDETTGDEWDEFFWNVTGHDWEVPIQESSATVSLPSDGILRVTCYQGPVGTTDNPCESSLTNSEATFTTIGIQYPGSDLTVVVAIQKGLIDVGPPVLVESIKDEWEQFLDWWSLSPLALIATAVLSGVILLVLIRLWWVNGRDRWYGDLFYLHDGDDSGPGARKPLLSRETLVVEYEPPKLGKRDSRQLRPAEIGVLLDERADTLDVSATIVDLAVRKHLKITETKSGGVFGLFKSTDYTFDRLTTDDTDLLAYESKLKNAIFETSDSVAMSTLKNKFYKDLERIKKSLYSQAISDKFFPRNPETTRTIYQVAGIVIAGVGVAVLIGLAISFSGAIVGIPIIFGGILLLFMSGSMPHRTAKGRTLFRRSLGFRKFMFSAETERQRFAERENIFSEYLPYAIVYGCVDRWAKAFADLGIVPSDPYWYSGTRPFNALYFANTVSSFSTSVSSTIASTPGGSGGSGFSGGGSSGGGGGGGGGGSW